MKEIHEELQIFVQNEVKDQKEEVKEIVVEKQNFFLNLYNYFTGKLVQSGI